MFFFFVPAQVNTREEEFSDMVYISCIQHVQRYTNHNTTIHIAQPCILHINHTRYTNNHTHACILISQLRAPELSLKSLAPFMPLTDTLLGRTRRPCDGLQEKYRFPRTEPSFFPRGERSSTPSHTPSAKSTGPI